MALSVFIEDSFDSAHWLPNVSDDHKCHRMHGHTYRIRIELTGGLSTQGWVIDYADVKVEWDRIKQKLDHYCLNNIDGLENPTCENIAIWIWSNLQIALPGLSRIEIRETECCGAIYTG